jgi:D-serine deaminase-like pyridoxal phosphate-dependent protein
MNFNQPSTNDKRPMANDNTTTSIPTPFLLVEEKIVRSNLDRIHDYAAQHGFAVRPHIKTHKSLFLARMQLDSGAVGLAAAKVEEAEVMATLGPIDLTIAYPAVGIARAQCIARLSLQQNISVAVDSEYLLNELASEAAKQGAVIGVHIIFDAGLHRCGSAEPRQIVRLAQYAAAHPGLRFNGIQIHLGHLYGDAARDRQCYERINQLWEPVYRALCAAGLTPETVSSGSTPSLLKPTLSVM